MAPHINATLNGMRSTIDAAGRIVVPKALRDTLGFQAGHPLELTAKDGVLEIQVAAARIELKKRGKGVVAVPADQLPSLTAEEVRATLERVRR